MTPRPVTPWSMYFLRIQTADLDVLREIARQEGTTVAAVIRRSVKAEIAKGRA